MSYKFLGFALMLILIIQVINVSYTANSFNPAVDYKIVTAGEKKELRNPRFSFVRNNARQYLENKEKARLERIRLEQEAEARRRAEEELRIKQEAEKAAEAARKAKALAEQKANEASNFNTNSKPNTTISGTKQEWMAAAGIPESDWQYVDFIVTRESTWNPNAVNSSSGACGLAQALPCAKTGCAQYNDPVCALRWQLGYVNAKYGGYAGAYSFWTKNHWY
jgi:soluble lytic murein transglycosylase-like protein